MIGNVRRKCSVWGAGQEQKKQTEDVTEDAAEKAEEKK